MNGRILIVEDDSLVAHSIAFALRREHFTVETVSTGAEGLAAAEERPPSLVILDLVLPGTLTGMDVCRELRRRSPVPIVVLTARDSESDKVLALDRGADDYVVKPFSLPELVGRVRAHLRRLELDRGEVISRRTIGDLEIDLLQREAWIAGERVHLTPSEFELLALLSEQPETVYSRHDIVARLWSSEYVGDMRACDTHIARLRRKIERDARTPQRLLSVRGVGYKLVGPIAA